MTTTTRGYEIRAIDPAVVAALRERDDAGQPPRLVISDGSSPLRCCLRLSRDGERLALVSYAPLRRWAQQTQADPGAYDEVGPVFIHPNPCGGVTDNAIPTELLTSSKVYRRYSSDGSILGGRLVAPGEVPERVLAEIFSDQHVALVHVRAVEFGCFTFEARRVTADRQL